MNGNGWKGRRFSQAVAGSESPCPSSFAFPLWSKVSWCVAIFRKGYGTVSRRRGWINELVSGFGAVSMEMGSHFRAFPPWSWLSVSHVGRNYWRRCMACAVCPDVDFFLFFLSKKRCHLISLMIWYGDQTAIDMAFYRHIGCFGTSIFRLILREPFCFFYTEYATSGNVVTGMVASFGIECFTWCLIFVGNALKNTRATSCPWMWCRISRPKFGSAISLPSAIFWNTRMEVFPHGLIIVRYWNLSRHDDCCRKAVLQIRFFQVYLTRQFGLAVIVQWLFSQIIRVKWNSFNHAMRLTGWTIKIVGKLTFTKSLEDFF